MKNTYFFLLVLFFCVGCQDLHNHIEWNGLKIPKENILNVGTSFFSDTDSNGDIAVSLSFPSLNVEELAVNLDSLNNVNNEDYKSWLNESYSRQGHPELKLNESGYFEFNSRKSNVSWELVELQQDSGAKSYIFPIANCTTLNLESQCNFSVFTNEYYFSFSMTGKDIKQAKRVIREIKKHIEVWKNTLKDAS